MSHYAEIIKKRLQTLLTNLSHDFSLDKLSKSPARFNTEKLNWFNRQYIQMMSLEEFAYRASSRVYSKKHPDKQLRLGDYVYLIDIEKQEVFTEITDQPFPDNDSRYHPLGGARLEGETWEQNLVREVREETKNQLDLNPSKAIWFGERQIIFNHPTSFDGGTWDGKSLSQYIYFVRKEEIKPCQSDFFPCDWTPLQTIIEQNKFFNYPMWKAFCSDHNLPCFEPTTAIKQQYLAWNLDKNRVTVLSEFGIDSGCVLNWEKPNIQDVQWKKITLEESLSNLKEIYEYIQEMFPAFKAQQDRLYSSILSPDINTEFMQLALDWETTIKAWLQDNQKDVGSYLWPLRVTLSGKVKSPSPFELLSILHHDQIQHRIQSILGA